MVIDDESKLRLAAAVAAEQARLKDIAAGGDWYFLKIDFFIPSGPPRLLLPPDREPEFTIVELCDLQGEDYGREYYLRSGRYLTVGRDREELRSLDEYRFTRCFLPELPWELED